jgi:urease accessory protein
MNADSLSASAPPNIAAARPWQAQLSLGFARQSGASRLIERSHIGPLRVQKPLYPEGHDVCHAIIVHPPGGVVGGDRLFIDARADKDAHALITTPGAAKWYRANGNRSGQQVNIDVAAGAAFEWLPQETIFFDAADVQLEHAVNLASEASYIGCDILCFGRTASGESFDRGRIAQRSTITVNGKMLWFEQGELLGGSQALRSPLGMAGNTVCATLIAVGRNCTSAQLSAIREQAWTIAGGPQCFGMSQTKGVTIARYLGQSSEVAKRLMVEVWQQLRPVVMGREAVVPRIWRT